MSDGPFDPHQHVVCDGCEEVFDVGELEDGRCHACLDGVDGEPDYDAVSLDEQHRAAWAQKQALKRR